MARAKLAVDIVRAIRNTTPYGFCVGILVGAVDGDDKSNIRDRLEQLTAIMESGVDYVHVSGGTFKKPTVRQELNTWLRRVPYAAGDIETDVPRASTR